MTGSPGEPSEAVRRESLQGAGESKPGAEGSTETCPRQLSDALEWTGEAKEILGANIDRGNLTGRGYDRVRRVARTLADLGESERVESVHVLEALSYRTGV